MVREKKKKTKKVIVNPDVSAVEPPEEVVKRTEVDKVNSRIDAIIDAHESCRKLKGL